jgi:hypothetical protein
MEASYELSFVRLHDQADYWQKAASKPQATARTGQFRVRKGLPYGVQFGGVLTHLHSSNLWALGIEMNLSLIDGFINAPDISLRTTINTALGNPDLSMLIVGADLAVSKSFGIAGLFALQPWAGYSFAFTHVQTHQIHVYVKDTDIKPDLMLLEAVQHATHRAAFGMRLVVTRVSIGFEFLRSFSDDLNVISSKLGVDF